MAQYLVVATTVEAYDAAEGENEPGDAFAATVGVHVCGESRQVHAAIRAVERAGDDWSVWEIVGSRTYRRSVIFQMDGSRSYDVKIQ